MNDASAMRWRAEVGLVAVTVIAAAGWVISKSVLEVMQPYTFIALRFLLAALGLACFCLRDLQGLSRPQFLRSAGTGAVLGGSLLLWVVALAQTRYVGVGAFIISLNVVAVPLLSRFLFGHVIGPGLLWALLPALLGLTLLTVDNNFVLEVDQWLFVISMLGFAMHLILTANYVQNTPPLALSTVQLAVAGSIATVAALATEQWQGGVSDRIWGLLLLSAFLTTSLRFAIQNRVLQHVTPSHASMVFLIEPIWTALLAAAVLDERMSLNQVLGCCSIMLALLIYRLR